MLRAYNTLRAVRCVLRCMLRAYNTLRAVRCVLRCMLRAYNACNAAQVIEVLDLTDPSERLSGASDPIKSRLRAVLKMVFVTIFIGVADHIMLSATPIGPVQPALAQPALAHAAGTGSCSRHWLTRQLSHGLGALVRTAGAHRLRL